METHLILFPLLLIAFCVGFNEESALFEDLFLNRNYSALARPVNNKSLPVIVRMNIAYVQLVGLVSGFFLLFARISLGNKHRPMRI